MAIATMEREFLGSHAFPIFFDRSQNYRFYKIAYGSAISRGISAARAECRVLADAPTATAVGDETSRHDSRRSSRSNATQSGAQVGVRCYLGYLRYVRAVEVGGTLPTYLLYLPSADGDPTETRHL